MTVLWAWHTNQGEYSKCGNIMMQLDFRASQAHTCRISSRALCLRPCSRCPCPSGAPEHGVCRTLLALVLADHPVGRENLNYTFVNYLLMDGIKAPQSNYPRVQQRGKTSANRDTRRLHCRPHSMVNQRNG